MHHETNLPLKLDADSTLDVTGVYQPAASTLPHSTGQMPADLPVIPGYAVSAEIARGGMGRVLAARDLTFDREVAVKVLLPGSRAERFLAEARITGRLPHPGIPPVHALGTLADGSPFLAMKLVRGRTLVEELQSQPNIAADWPRFVQIFEQIAQAVGFAHSQGIVHRDLKPANVMVGAFGEVQVMDWGLAKVLTDLEPDEADERPESAVSSYHTLAGSVLGTPSFMAPEQARGEEVDAQADVFALGGILTAILTLQPVFAGESTQEMIDRAAAGEVSGALARLDASGADGELVALAKRCLSPQPGDRPRDGQEVAALVAAYRAGVAERLRRAETDRAAAEARALEQQKRRKVTQHAAAALVAVLTIGILGTGIGLLQARAARLAESRRAEGEHRAKLEADAQKTMAMASAAAEKAANELTQKRLSQIEKGNEIITAIFADLDMRKFQQGPDPLEAVLAKRLVKAGEQLEGEAVGDPLVVAHLQNRLGHSLLSLGYYNDAIPLFAKAYEMGTRKLGADHPFTLSSGNNLGRAYRAAGKLDLALPLLKQTLELSQATLGADHPDTLTRMNNLAQGYHAASRLDLAQPLLEQTVALMKATLGTDHPDTLASMTNLAESYRVGGKPLLALPLMEATLKLMETNLGADHPDTLTTMSNLARTYDSAGKLDLALKLHERTLLLRKTKLGADHPATLASMNNLATAYRTASKIELALPLYEETLALSRAKLGSDHPNTLASINNLAIACLEARQFGKALPLFEEYVRHARERNDPTLAIRLNQVSRRLLAAGQFAAAEPYLTECLAICEKTQPEAWTRFNAMSLLGGALCGQKKYDEAEPLLRAGYEGLVQRESSMPRTAGALIPEAIDRLIELYASKNQPDELKHWQDQRARHPQQQRPIPKPD